MATCPHGFSQDQCLICDTLGTPGRGRRDGAGKKARLASPAEERPTRVTGLYSDPPAPLPATRGSVAEGKGRSRGRRSHGLGSLVAVVAAVFVAALLIWAFAGIFDLAFRVAEYVALAIVAGWLGYKLGHARGRRGH
ncbi:MAG: hypothetical protein ACRDZX_17130 [Acidimicrobiales bacterium]